jgi:homoserine acetyltransferase
MPTDPTPPTPPSNTDPEAEGDRYYDWRNDYDVTSKQRKYNVTFDDRKDPNHPLYLYEQRRRHRTTAATSSKDTANLEAVEDPELVPSTARDIPSHATSEAMPLDATAREDTMREDAPLATSHDTSLSPTSADAMPGGLSDSCALQRTRTYDSRTYPDGYPFYL